MLNKIWPFFIIISIIYGIFFGNIEQINNSIFDSTEDTIKITMTLLGTMCLWSGLMKIAMNLKIINKFCELMDPFLNFLFPRLRKNKKIKKEISMNIVANFLGIGNAATPLGLKAMEDMQKENKNKDILTDDMMMFIVINTASIQLIPTTIIAIRKSLGAVNPTEIILPVWCATICAAISGICMTKFLIKKQENNTWI